MREGRRVSCCVMSFWSQNERVCLRESVCRCYGRTKRGACREGACCGAHEPGRETAPWGVCRRRFRGGFVLVVGTAGGGVGATAFSCARCACVSQ